ncbi:hypothetical protein [Candidatus Phycosocius spiralis]|uniref:HTH lysR-type domain-containing protein n=1 Tax=Candidatus Phycosocius spiralis TaxID=2815099 RepID=A0ABQ4PSG1_9PROT|nr:hypothetical protein [Candidatus Phycosocius spiralis]GIU65944.1 hypothetical protein PsB1_0098 [Candidatus Phycosocius spiralis]
MALDSLRQIDIISALAGHGKFQKASKALEIAQRSLSRSLSAVAGLINIVAVSDAVSAIMSEQIQSKLERGQLHLLSLPLPHF